MKKDQLIIGLVSFFALLFLISPFLGFSDAVIFILYFLIPFLFAFMGLAVLKQGKPSAHTFDEQFYEDNGYKRNGTEEGDR